MAVRDHRASALAVTTTPGVSGLNTMICGNAERPHVRCNTWLAYIAIGVSFMPLPASADEAFFRKQVQPLLEEKCLSCHSDNIRKGDFSLTTASDALQSDYIDTASPESSHLLDVVIGTDDEPARMPKEGDSLTTEQIRILRRWITEGAAWPENVRLAEQAKTDGTWWSLQPVQKVQPPEWPSQVRHPGFPTNEIDAFVANGLQKNGLQFNPQAERRKLIRRATFDLTGLPPSPEDVDAFVHNDDPKAWPNLIDRLLDSSEYGEHWGRHWLDVVRFGESNGFERNVIINELWPFRDYVIQSFNDDKPFNRFIKEHLAGDVLAPGDPAIEVGSAFLVAGPYDNVGNQDAVQAAQIRANTIDEMIRASSEAFLGLTVGCARCHDHKFDPILQADYYSLYSTFAGIRHGAREVATKDMRDHRNQKLQPLRQQRAELDQQRKQLAAKLHERANARADELQKQWVRPPVSRTGTEDTFDPVEAKFVRFVSLGQDSNPADRNNFRIDEFEVWSADEPSRNVALASNGTTASGSSRRIDDFPGAYGPELVIDGKSGRRFIGNQGRLTLEFSAPEFINRIVFSSAKHEPNPALNLFTFVSDYRIEASMDGENWDVIASSKDRQPVSEAHRAFRLKQLVTTSEDRKKQGELDRRIRELDRQIAAIPGLPRLWVGSRDQAAAKGPFHIFTGGNPQRKGPAVVTQSLAILQNQEAMQQASYELQPTASEADRRVAFADWITNDNHPLTPRVLANRIWHYHFGTGLVSTPSDFGYMGSPPSHPELLDWLTNRLIENDWKIKELHRLIMMSATYQQSTASRTDAMAVDADSRLLWRYPVRRLSAEEIRDSMLSIAGVLDDRSGGPGFRLYEYQQDNVATYVPLEVHGPETYRRAVYHQNARASVVDLMTEFDQPDCAFGAPRRSVTTTPLQALTALNHSFTLAMSQALAERLRQAQSQSVQGQIKHAFRLCYGRHPTDAEQQECIRHTEQYGLESLCRVLLNTSELIYLD